MATRNSVLTTRPFSNKYTTFRGPPLPIVIHHSVNQEAEIEQLIALVKDVPNGDSNQYAEEFVKAVIDKIENLQFWAEGDTTFYVLLNGTRANKYIAQGWRYVPQAHLLNRSCELTFDQQHVRCGRPRTS